MAKNTNTHGNLSPELYQIMADASSVNIMICNEEGVIVYANPSSLDTLQSIEEHLPVAADDIVGSSFDIFHKDPSFQKGLLRNPKRNFPRQTMAVFNEEVTLDISVDALYQDGDFKGLTAIWTLATERIKAETEAQLKNSIIESSPQNIMTCDLQGVVTYLNPAAVATLGKIEDELPCRVGDIIGQPVDIFHKDPSYQQRLFRNPSANFPRQAILEYGNVILDLTANTIQDASGEAIGFLAFWDLATQRIKAEKISAINKSMVENSPINMMACDAEGIITYLNPASVTTLRSIESLLPCKVDEVIGKPFDIFHKDPAFQQNLLKSPDANFPRKGLLDFRGVKLDLTATAIKDQNGEFAGLLACWEDVTDQIAAKEREEKVTEGIRENASMVSSASTELTTAAQQMSTSVDHTVQEVNRSTKLGESLSEEMDTVMNSTEEMTVAIKEISSGAQESARIANEASQTAIEANQTVQALGESSSEISNVIKAISSVAQQTNLLALNATIEAARAGEAGKGFAVVASEIKELAKETRAATEDITKKIEKIQSDTGRAVKSIETITEIINRLNEIANTTASSVEEQSATTNEMARSISNANTSATQIAEGLNSVLGQITEVADGVKQNTEAAEDLSKAAEKLNSLANS